MTILKLDVLSVISHLPDRIDLDALIRQFQQLEHTQETNKIVSRPPRSFLQAARRYAGCIKDAVPDLATNSSYMEGYGE